MPWKTKSSMRFLVDENLSPRLAGLLSDEGHDVLFVPASSYRGQADHVLHDLAVAEERVVITRDVRFPVTSDLSGIVLVRSGNQTPSQLLDMMRGFLAAVDLLSLQGK